MKRREHGVNLDDGVALATPEEFHLLFVDCRPKVRADLHNWLASTEKEPILLGGQIGSGKTTLLNEAISRYANFKCIRIRFDTEPIEPNDAGFTLLFMGKVLKACLKAKINPKGCGITLSDFQSLRVKSWSSLANITANYPSNLETVKRLKEACAIISEVSSFILKACGILLDKLAEKAGLEPIIIAEGVDKFLPATADYFSLRNIIDFLAKRKTLFEVNAVHLFHEQEFPQGIRKLFLGGVEKSLIYSMFEKRLGTYTPLYRDAFSTLAKYSGNNIRQALRLLNAYYFQKTQYQNDISAAIALACHQVSSDLLNIPFGYFPVEIFSVVKKNGFIEGSLFSEPSTSQGANEAIYHNWLFLQTEPYINAPTRWPAVINPMIIQAVTWEIPQTLTPEEQAVQNWAREHDVSPIGLNIPLDAQGKPAWDKFWREIESSSLSKKDALNIVKLLEQIGAGLFSIERQDRIIVTYEKRTNLKATRDYLVGKANTYGFFPCREIILTGGEGNDPIAELLVQIADRDPNLIYSIELTGNWTDSQLRDLEHRRDKFDNLQMLWWVQRDALKKYLHYWPQLRQFFRIYQLEDELWKGITAEEIQDDIELINDIFEKDDSEGVRRLQYVLAYLKTKGQKA